MKVSRLKILKNFLSTFLNDEMILCYQLFCFFNFLNCLSQHRLMGSIILLCFLLFFKILTRLELEKPRRGVYQVLNHIFLLTIYQLISLITRVITLYEHPFLNDQSNFHETLKHKSYSIIFEFQDQYKLIIS